MLMHLCLFTASTLFHLYYVPRLIISQTEAKFKITDRVRGHYAYVGKDFRYENDLRCDKASEIGVTRLATVRCPTGLAFDIERQTCDWKTNVKNCDQLESKRTSRLFP